MSKSTHAHTVRIEPLGISVTAEETVSIWRSCKAAGVRLPKTCLNGTCRACLCQLQAGRVRYLVDWPGVSPDERDEGWILPCVAAPACDVILLVPEARLDP